MERWGKFQKNGLAKTSRKSDVGKRVCEMQKSEFWRVAADIFAATFLLFEAECCRMFYMWLSLFFKLKNKLIEVKSGKIKVAGYVAVLIKG